MRSSFDDVASEPPFTRNEAVRVIRRGAGWALRLGGRTEATFATRDEAVENAASVARKRGADLLVQARTGRRMIGSPPMRQMRPCWSCGSSPTREAMLIRIADGDRHPRPVIRSRISSDRPRIAPIVSHRARRRLPEMTGGDLFRVRLPIRISLETQADAKVGTSARPMPYPR